MDIGTSTKENRPFHMLHSQNTERVTIPNLGTRQVTALESGMLMSPPPEETLRNAYTGLAKRTVSAVFLFLTSLTYVTFISRCIVSFFAMRLLLVTRRKYDIVDTVTFTRFVSCDKPFIEPSESQAYASLARDSVATFGGRGDAE